MEMLRRTGKRELVNGKVEERKKKASRLCGVLAALRLRRTQTVFIPAVGPAETSWETNTDALFTRQSPT